MTKLKRWQHSNCDKTLSVTNLKFWQNSYCDQIQDLTKLKLCQVFWWKQLNNLMIWTAHIQILIELSLNILFFSGLWACKQIYRDRDYEENKKRLYQDHDHVLVSLYTMTSIPDSFCWLWPEFSLSLKEK